MMKSFQVNAVLGGALLLVMAGCTHGDKKDLLRSTNVSLADAIRTAEASVTDSKAVEAELESKDGRAVYEVELIDVKRDKRKVYVDAGTGKIFQIH
ncbi:MAG TPA: PepSY domain-containing protein [Nitrospiraceae bacterium]|jgi:uncharacterized membrane protein YkoI|nr:PepSY domain-containing protein [Nitrospiraceae bacterium]